MKRRFEFYNFPFQRFLKAPISDDSCSNDFLFRISTLTACLLNDPYLKSHVRTEPRRLFLFSLQIRDRYEQTLNELNELKTNYQAMSEEHFRLSTGA